jgi:isopenicillin N synthase-like dioxygenase
VHELPVIDVAPLLAPRAATASVADVAGRIDAACRDVGFFSIVGHGVDPALRARLDAAARGFFARSEAEKNSIAMTEAGRAWRGWFPLGGELTSGVADDKEGLYFGAELPPDDPRVRARTPLHGPNLFPTTPAALRPLVLAYLDELTQVGQAVLSGMAIGLGLEPRWFRDHLTADPLVLFRIFRYPPTDSTATGWGVAEHTDYGLLTILGQDVNGGLQVHTPSGWIDVAPDPTAFVCNLGDMLERLTRGRYRSTPHRVRNRGEGDRLSFPFFLDPSWDAAIDPLPIAGASPDEQRTNDRWDQTSVHGEQGTYGEYITAKVAKVFPYLVS